MNVLGFISDSVSLFGIINDKENKVIFVIDTKLKGIKLLLRLNRNIATNYNYVII